MATLTIKPTVSAIRHTESGKSYWDNNGAYNEEYSRLYDELVPASGDTKMVHGELIRAISRLGYEYNNNGNFNAAEPYYADPEYDVDDDGEEYCINEDEIDHIDIAPYYDRMLNFISTYAEVEGLADAAQVEEAVEGVRYVILQAPNYTSVGGYFQESFQACYNALTDLVMHVVLNTEDMPNPEYEEEQS